ncbi:MAG: thioredoxin domain-containing protein [bacterium]|nr:thioredoxin domain-containing protein [bacterium]
MEELPAPQRHWFKPMLLLLALFVLVFFTTVLGVDYRRAHPSQTDPLASLTAGSASQSTSGTVSGTVRPAIPQIETADDPYLGPAEAKVIVVEFIDFQCPFCKQVYPMVRELAAQYGNRVKFILRDFPLNDIHPEAQAAAEASGCAFEQGNDKFWAYHDKLYQNQELLNAATYTAIASQVNLNEQKFATCMSSGARKSEILGDLADGAAIGVTGTPTFFLNGYLVKGTFPKDMFAKALDLLLK